MVLAHTLVHHPHHSAYRIMTGSGNDDSDSSSQSTPKGEARTMDERGLLTAAELVRRKASGGGKTKSRQVTTNEHDAEDIDDEIKRLEAELAEDSLSSSSDSDFSEGTNGDEESEYGIEKAVRGDNRKKKKISFGETEIINNHDQVSDNRVIVGKESAIICESSCAVDSIAPLPSMLLPKCKSKKLKIDLEGDNANNEQTSSSKMSRKRKRSKKNGNGGEENAQKSDGLRDAVLEVLQGYVARSSERIPFYCRVCSHQSSNEEEFFAHKKTEFHKTAVEVERKKTFCKLCRKQLTSLVQMQEHLESRPHKEKLEYMRARQKGESTVSQSRRNDNAHRGKGSGGGGRGGGRGRGRGRGERGGRWHDSKFNKRQWC